MRSRPARHLAGLIACLAMVAAGVTVLVRAGDLRPTTTTTISEAAPAALPTVPPVASAGAAAPAPTVTPPTVTPPPVTAPNTDQNAEPSTRPTRRTTSRAQPASFPAVSGALISNSSPLKDVRQDQGMSVPLPDGRSLWIFADTTQSVTPYFFVTSSAAVSKRGSTALTYAATGKRLPVEFLPRTKAERAATAGGQYTAVWPTGATMLPDGRILISYASYRVTTSPATFTLLGAGLYTFRYQGLSRFRDGAQATRIASNLWSASEGAIGSPVHAGEYVYFTTCEKLQCYSVRSPVGGLTTRSSYRWWTGKTWSAGRADRAPMAYGSSKPGLNPSIAYLPAYGVYATTGTAVGHVSRTGLLWVAPHPWGPWSSAASFSLPNCPAAGCYTLNLHPSESVGGRVRISYATSGVGPYVRVTDVRVTIRGTSSVTIR